MKTKRHKRINLLRGRPTPATGPNEQRSMDFVHDQMLDERAFRVLKMIDQSSGMTLPWFHVQQEVGNFICTENRNAGEQPAQAAVHG